MDDKVMVETNTSLKACRICGNTQGNVEHVAREMMFGLRHEFEYIECGTCKCLQIKEIPQDMSPYYPEQYYSFGAYDGKKFKGLFGNLRKWKYASLVSENHILRKIVKSISSKKDYDIFDDLKVRSTTKILDVGCGNGQNFLYPLAEIGFTDLLGCDPYLEASITYTNGLHIIDSDVHQMSGKWDIITYHHAFEHINDPIESLNKVYDLLEKEGVCVIRIPTVSSFAWQHYKTNWVQLDAPRHFFLHSIKSMAKLAELANLELVRVVYDSNDLQFRGSEKYVQDISLFTTKKEGVLKTIQNKIKKYNYKQRAKKLNKNNQGDQAAFYLRKKISGSHASTL